MDTPSASDTVTQARFTSPRFALVMRRRIHHRAAAAQPVHSGSWTGCDRAIAARVALARGLAFAPTKIHPRARETFAHLDARTDDELRGGCRRVRTAAPRSRHTRAALRP